MKSRRWFLGGVMACVAASLVACSVSSSKAAPPAATGAMVDAGGGLKISGPFTHENLSVFLVHSQKRDDREFLTLDEGLKTKQVTVSEKKSATVQELIIDNQSGKPLFLQEGDRITGGKQDRTIYTSLVIKAKSGPTPIPSFCVEASRWQAGDKGYAFAAGSNTALAGKSVRYSAKISKDQGRVWKQVAQQKEQLQKSLKVDNNTSSLNEALDSKKVIEATERYEKNLGHVGKDHADVVGVAMVVDGELQEVSVYPGHTLWTKIYPRLLQSYAADAAATRKKDAKVKQIAAIDVAKFMAGEGDDKQKKVRAEKLNAGNGLEIDGDKARLRCISKWGDQVIHRQWLKREKDAPAQPRGNRELQQQQLENLNEEQIQRLVPQQRQQRGNSINNDAPNRR